MLFNSIDFAVYLPIVFLLHWFIFNKNLKQQNAFLLVASYIFYGWWDWRFLGLIALSSFIDFLIGKRLYYVKSEHERKFWLFLSLAVNLGVLGIFKYFDFFMESFVQSISFIGYQIEPTRINIILPVGISFYTFQTLSYTIDVYRKKIEPSHNWISFFAFVSFFPQLVAGPIERASHLLPQFRKVRKFQYNLASDGMRQILYGFFKKLVIADNCAKYVNDIFQNYHELSGSTLAIGAVLFSFQIYCDFSGYSDIAIGTSKVFGLKLQQNFAYPYFSRDIAEFWRRWHISLSTWFRDYLYIPLGGNKGSKLKRIRNTFIVFLVSGLWHGSNWTFIVWGGIHALIFLPLMMLDLNRKHVNEISNGKYSLSPIDFLKIVSTFSLVTFSWIFFRARSLNDAFNYISRICSESLFSIPSLNSQTISSIHFFIILLIFILAEWIQRGKSHALVINNITPGSRRIIYTFILIVIFTYGRFNNSEFIYFQF